ncbi:MAG: 30S ribosomal protein S6--L-glutamate ligase, partial [Gammaproteobacteria bacterium]
SMMRQGAEGDFRSNLHRGGSAHKIKITPEERSTAVRAARKMGLNVSGVDILRSNHGPVVLEVNSSPGLEGIEKATERDVAGQIVQFIENNAKRGRTRTRGQG